MFGKPDSFKVRSRAIIMHERKLLVVKHSETSPFYALPGGHIDHGEEPKGCLVRELREELGVSAQVGRLAYVHTFKDRYKQYCVEFMFFIENPADFIGFETNARSHAHEIFDAQWVGEHDGITILPEQIAKKVFEKDSGNEMQFISG